MVSRRLRYEILRRDDHACRYCGGRAPEVKLTVDHVMPTALGGSDEPDNLVTACQDCNAGKSSVAPDSPIVENVSDDALRWARAMAQAAELQAAQHEQRRAYIDSLNDFWHCWHTSDSQPVFRPENWADSLARFHDLGLELERAEGAMETALNNNRIKSGETWRYFCGIAWSILRERQEMARDMLDSGAVE